MLKPLIQCNVGLLKKHALAFLLISATRGFMDSITTATPLPAPIAIGSTWNAALVRQAGEIVGREAKALGYTNVCSYSGLTRSALGRVLEYGEEPFHVTHIGQGNGGRYPVAGVAATLKHFVVYSVPQRWDVMDMHVPTQASLPRNAPVASLSLIGRLYVRGSSDGSDEQL